MQAQKVAHFTEKTKMGAMDAESAMASTQPLTPSASNSSITCSRGCVKLENSPSDPFPAGLRVLVVDDDPICLLILDRMLRRCLYQVTTCEKATAALEMLREKRDSFDLVISDVYMPDMDGFKLLELVGLEMDLPVIMMSANGETSAVMKGIKHGACDYLLKPVRMEELRNIWQHVVRKKWRSSEQATSREDDRHQRVTDDSDYTSSANEGFDGVWNKSKKRKDIKEEDEDVDQDNDDPSTTKKPRVVWSVDLHQQFVAAVNQLGIDKAVPKRILELMNVQGLTRENVASHLQKYRLYLKRISGVSHQPGGLNSSFAGSPDSNFGAVGVAGLGGLGDLRTLAATGQLSPQALVSLQAGLLGRLGPTNIGLGSVDPSLLLAALQGASNGALTRPSYSQPLLCNQANLQGSGPSELKQFAQASQQLQGFGQMAGSLDKGPTGMSPLQQQQQQLAGSVGLGAMVQRVGVNSNLQINPNNNALMMQLLQQQGVGHSTTGGVSALPPVGNLGQHGLPAEMGAWANSLSNVNVANSGIGVQNTGSIRPGPASNLLVTGSSSPNILGSLGRATCVDSKGLQLPNVGNPNPLVLGPICVSSPLSSTGLDSDLGAPRVKNIGSSLGAVSEGSPQALNTFASNFISPPGMKHGLGLNINQRSRAGCQGFGLSQEFGHTNSPAPSPRYSQASSNSQGLNLGSGQEHGLRAPVFGTGFPGNLGMDGRMKASVGNVSSQSDQSTAESDLKGKEGSFGLLMGRKADPGLLSEPAPEDLLSMLLKQQQEGLSLSESDLAASDSYPLDNM